MRLLAYNILEGLRPLQPIPHEPRLVDRERARLARSVVEELAPDVLVLNEALFCQQYGGRLVDYRALFGFKYSSVALYDQAWGNAVLSQFPITDSHQMRIEDRGGLVVSIETPEGPLTVASYHPHPSREPSLRVGDFTRLVEGVHGPLLVAGDFNCVHPDDHVDEGNLVEAFKAFSQEPPDAVRRFVESGQLVFAALSRFGLKDAIPAAGRRFTIPTDLLRTDKQSAMRIDHILCNGGIKVVDGQVVHSPATQQASDHHPVLLEFTLAKEGEDPVEVEGR